MGEPEPKVGDKVAWNWGSSSIQGEVVEQSTGKMTKEIKNKPITKNGEKDNPAYFVKQTQKSGISGSSCFCFCVLCNVLANQAQSD